jgi:hypothetical protein
MVHFAAILMCAVAIASVASAYQSREFDSMVFYMTNRHPNDYNSYRCWCGANASSILSNNTVDETDLCCKTHAECHDNVQVLNTSCDTNGKYHAVYHNQQIQCIDNSGTSNYEYCMCDKQAAECFKQSLATFNPANENVSSSSVCQPSSIHVCVPECPTYQTCSNGVCVGVGEFGISVTWSRPGDGDIHVTTPSQKWIYYRVKGPSASTDQGQLDHDDRTGTGPENVFWNVTAPIGVYHICFDQYSFISPSSPTNPITATFIIRRPARAPYTLTKTFTSGVRLNTHKCDPSLPSFVGSVEYP